MLVGVFPISKITAGTAHCTDSSCNGCTAQVRRIAGSNLQSAHLLYNDIMLCCYYSTNTISCKGSYNLKNNPKREENMQPIIKTNAWYTLVTGKSEVINASWCKQQLARILKKSTDAIILFDVTGSYAALALDHDRLIPGQVPMAVKQYKSTPEGFVLAHTVKVDVEDSQEPRLLVFDVSWVMAFSWKKGIAAITKILKVWMMCEPQAEPVWLFMNIDPYGFELSDSEGWECLERIVKEKEFKVKPVFLTKGKTEREINERLHIKA